MLEPQPSESEQWFQHPRFLPHEPGGRRLIFAMGAPGNTQIVAQDLETGRREVLGSGDQPVYSRTGHVVYETPGGLWATPFSVETLQRTGKSFPIPAAPVARCYRNSEMPICPATWPRYPIRKHLKRSSWEISFPIRLNCKSRSQLRLGCSGYKSQSELGPTGHSAVAKARANRHPS